MDPDALRQPADDDAVADEDDQTRKHKADQNVLKVKYGGPYVAIFRVESLTDDNRFFSLLFFIYEIHLFALRPCKDHVGHSESDSREPDGHIDDLVGQHLPDHVAVSGSHYCEVPVQADEGQDEHTAVQVDGVDHVHGHAQETSKVPAAGRVHSPEGQREHKQQVGHREMQAVLVGHSLDLLLVAHDHNHQAIADDPQDEYYSVNNGQENLVEVSAGISVTLKGVVVQVWQIRKAFSVVVILTKCNLVLGEKKSGQIFRIGTQSSDNLQNRKKRQKTKTVLVCTPFILMLLFAFSVSGSLTVNRAVCSTHATHAH